MNRNRAGRTDAVVRPENAEQAFGEIREIEGIELISKDLNEREPQLASALSVFLNYALGCMARQRGGLEEDEVALLSLELRRAAFLVYRAVTLGYRDLLTQECTGTAKAEGKR